MSVKQMTEVIVQCLKMQKNGKGCKVFSGPVA